MQANCPVNPDHKQFVTVAYVSEDWVVDERGEFVEVASNSDHHVLNGPNPGNIWTCKECGTQAMVKE